MEIETKKQRRKKLSAMDKLMDYLARRDHSPKELHEKLSKNGYEVHEIEDAIQRAQENGWILPLEELAQKVKNQLDNKGKGGHYILNYLRQKGLPEVEIFEETEHEKAQNLIEKKFQKFDKPWSSDIINKVYRFLLTRGYSPSLSRRISYEKSRN